MLCRGIFCVSSSVSGFRVQGSGYRAMRTMCTWCVRFWLSINSPCTQSRTSGTLPFSTEATHVAVRDSSCLAAKQQQQFFTSFGRHTSLLIAVSRYVGLVPHAAASVLSSDSFLVKGTWSIVQARSGAAGRAMQFSLLQSLVLQ